MAGTKEDKRKYSEELTYLKRKMDEINQKISHLESKKGENEKLDKILISSHLVDLVTVYNAMTDLSMNLLGYKNESYLDAGRKSLYKSLILLEGVVSNAIDIPLNENYELLNALEDFQSGEIIIDKIYKFEFVFKRK